MFAGTNVKFSMGVQAALGGHPPSCSADHPTFCPGPSAISSSDRHSRRARAESKHADTPAVRLSAASPAFPDGLDPPASIRPGPLGRHAEGGVQVDPEKLVSASPALRPIRRAPRGRAAGLCKAAAAPRPAMLPAPALLSCAPCAIP